MQIVSTVYVPHLSPFRPQIFLLFFLIFMHIFSPSTMSCAFSGLTQVEFISREIFKRKYAKKDSFGKWEENGADYLEQPKWMLKSVSLILEDIDGLLTDWSSFQWKELLLLN